MKTFLQETAEYLVAHEDTLYRHCLILPSNRAAKVLREQLSSNSRKTMLMPEIFSIATWMEQLSGSRIPEEEEMLLMLFEIHNSLHPNDNISFQKFAANAQMLLKDFNDIDISLADPDKVFASKLEIEEMEAEIQERKQLSRRYLAFCKELPTYYRQFKTNLSAKNLAYQGMQYRGVYEQLTSRIERLPYEKYIFIGFNALSVVEEKIITQMHQMQKAEMIIDCDASYLKEANTATAEVPSIVGEFIRDLKTHISPIIFTHDFLHEVEKTIDIIGVPQESSQAEILPEQIEKYRAENPSASCVIVLLKENLLLPVLYALPDEKVNISMEYRFTHTSLYQLIHLYLNTIENRERFSHSQNEKAKLYHRDVQNFFQNAFIQKRLELSGKILDFSKDNQLFYHEDELREKIQAAKQDEQTAAVLCNLFFNKKEHVQESIAQLLRFLDHKSLPENYLRLLHYLSEHIASLLQVLQCAPETEITSARLLVENMLSRLSIPFQSDSHSPLQIMGMLETRALDFEQVIILSTNEGIIPNAKSSRTLLPYDLRLFYKLPTYHKHEAIMTYHFYRLIQRAKKICLCYNTDNRKEVNEKSRLILQLQTHWKHLKNIHFQETLIPFPQSQIPEKTPIEIEKDQTLINKIGNLAFSPSSLNTYLSCPLKFYFRYILHLQLPKKTDEVIAANTMGSIMHSILEKKLNPEHPDYSTKELKDELIAAFANPELTQLSLKKEEICHEKNLLILELCHRYLKDYLQKFAEEVKASGIYPVQEVEAEMGKQTVDIRGKKVCFSGVIDRVDYIGEHYRIIDYKTGHIDGKNLKIKTMDEVFDGKHAEAFQLLLYMFLLHRERGFTSIEGEIISFQHPNQKLPLSVGDKNIFEASDFQEFENQLSEQIDNIINIHIPFQRLSPCNPNERPCKYCDYVTLC